MISLSNKRSRKLVVQKDSYILIFFKYTTERMQYYGTKEESLTSIEKTVNNT